MRPATELQPGGGSVGNSGAWLRFSFEFGNLFENCININNVQIRKLRAKSPKLIWTVTPGFTRKAGSVMAKAITYRAGGSHRTGASTAGASAVRRTRRNWKPKPKPVWSIW